MNPSDLIPTEHPTPSKMAGEAYPDAARSLSARDFHAGGIKAERRRLRAMLNDATKALLDASNAAGTTPDGYRCQGAAEALIALSQGLAP